MAADHPLDRPCWNALTTRQSGLARGSSRAVRLDPAYGLFIAAADPGPESLRAAADLLDDDFDVAMVEADPWPRVPGVLNHPPVPLVQMLAGALIHVAAKDFQIVDLAEADAPDMFALARLTKPGPFFRRTHRLGDFVGVRVDGGLAAMAGERMKLPGFTEISAVCTHPDHRGRGYAAALMGVVAARIEARGESPFLHVYPHNTGAIRLYEQLGYRVRREMNMTALSRG